MSRENEQEEGVPVLWCTCSCLAQLQSAHWVGIANSPSRQHHQNLHMQLEPSARHADCRRQPGAWRLRRLEAKTKAPMIIKDGIAKLLRTCDLPSTKGASRMSTPLESPLAGAAGLFTPQNWASASGFPAKAPAFSSCAPTKLSDPCSEPYTASTRY